MDIIINIKEENNRLEICDCGAAIVCGNSNYVLKFSFCEQWNSCSKKAAIFVVDGNKLTVDFDGDECRVPVLPNASFVQVSLVSGLGETEFATTAVKIRLEPTISGGDFSEFNQLTNYLPKVLGAINKIESGDVVAKNAKSADVAKIASNVANPNLLINGDFKINQRAQESYALVSGYTVDRWKVYQANAKCIVTPTKKGIVVDNSNGTSFATFRQEFEYFETLQSKTVTYSVKCTEVTGNVLLYFEDGVESTRYSSQLTEGMNALTVAVDANATKCSFGVNLPAGAKVTFEYAKAEIGQTATEFIPRLYAEELSLCQRYFVRINSREISGSTAGSSSTSSTLVYAKINYPVEMRIAGTRIQLNPLSISCQTSSGVSNISQNSSGLYFSYVTTKGGWFGFANWSGLPVASPFFVNQEGVCLEIDAEIY